MRNRDVKVQVIRLSAHAVDEQVHVDVDGIAPHLEAFDAGFLGGLTQRDECQRGLAVGVTTRLQPATDLRVQEHYAVGCLVVHHPGGCSEVPWRAGAMQRI